MNRSKWGSTSYQSKWFILKKYNRKTKKWEEEKNTETSLKKRETCRGGKPHIMELVFPTYIDFTGDITSSKVEKYYKLEKQKEDYLKKHNEQLLAIGIHSRIWNEFGVIKYLQCSICGKKDYIRNK